MTKEEGEGICRQGLWPDDRDHEDWMASAIRGGGAHRPLRRVGLFRGSCGALFTADLPPALAAVVVFVINNESGVFHHGTDPAHAVVAIVPVLHQSVLDEESLGRAFMHVDAEHFFSGVNGVSCRLVIQRVAPVGAHAGKALRKDQLPRMLLRVPGNAFFPILADQVVAALRLQPGKGPLIVSAEVVATDHDRDARVISSRSCGGRPVLRGMNLCTQRPLPP